MKCHKKLFHRELFSSVLSWAATLLENLTDDAFAKLCVTIFSTISIYLTKRYVT